MTAGFILLAAMAPPVQTPPQELIGHWRGEARIVVSWTQQRTLPVDISVSPDGSIAGKVGDATLSDVRIKRHGRFWTGVLHNTRYTLHGKLQGPILSEENVVRKKFWILVSPAGERLEGGVNTSGAHGLPWQSQKTLKKKMWLAARGLVLNRIAEPE